MISQLKMSKKQLLIEVATKLFVERGFHATPTSVITQEAGMSSGILFHYFKTKDDLITQIYVELKKEYTDSILRDIEQFKAGRSKIRMIWSNSWNWGLKNPIKFDFLRQLDNSTYVNSVKNHPEIIAKNKLFEDLFQEYTNNRFIRNVDIYFTMDSMFALINSMVNHLTLYPELKDDNSFIEQAWDMFYNYLKF